MQRHKESDLDVIKLMIPDMPSTNELIPYLRRIDQTRQYSNNGPLVRQLEAELSERLDGAGVLAVSNGTVAIELILRALDMPRARVVVPSVTFVATGQAVWNAGMRAILTDVDRESWQMDRWPTVDCDICLPVAAFGVPVPTSSFAAAATESQPVVIDAAGALTCQEIPNSEHVHLAYSLHATKFVGCGEGGLVVSRNADLLSRVEELRAFGRHGTNAKMSEYHAAVALAALGRIVGKRHLTVALATEYLRILPAEVEVQTGVMGDRTMFNVLLPPHQSAAHVIDAMGLRGVECRQWYAPFLHERVEFAGAAAGRDFTVSEMIAARMISLPFHTRMTLSDVNRVCIALFEVLGGK
jgi:dTDP-4-amino-4,6-dideoxygalactose transaminase